MAARDMYRCHASRTSMPWAQRRVLRIHVQSSSSRARQNMWSGCVVKLNLENFYPSAGGQQRAKAPLPVQKLP